MRNHTETVAGMMMAEEAAREPTFRYEDVPDLAETFADTIGQWHFDGSTLRIEFLISRFDEPSGRTTDRTGRRRPACRLVLSTAAAVDMINHCRQMSDALQKAGMVQKTERRPPAS
jgi:hypothetical protein